MIKKRSIFLGFQIIYIFLNLIFFFPSYIYAQGLVSVLPPESPSSLFSGSIGDDDVEFLIDGFWEASASSTGQFVFDSSSTSFNPVPLLFKQLPDLYTILRYKEKWLFEAYITDDATKSLFLLAYEGDDEEFVKSARLGNDGIKISDIPYMSFGLPLGAFGLAFSAFDKDKKLSFESMLRWEGLEWKNRTFYGNSENLEVEINIKNYIRGRHFVLPDKDIVSAQLTETISNESRVLRSDEYSISITLGTLLLEKECEGELYITLTKADGSSTEYFLYKRSTDSNGNIVRTGSLYEARNLYALSSSDSVKNLFVRSLTSGSPDLKYDVYSLSSGLVEVCVAGAQRNASDYGYTKPFYNDAAWLYNDDVSSNQVPKYPTETPFVIIASSLEKFDTIEMESTTVPGSISVYRNGISSLFLYDENTRNLSLIPQARTGEKIEIRYAVSSSDRSRGALSYASSVKLPFWGFDWQFALGGKQAFSGSGFDEAGKIGSSWTALSLSAKKELDNFNTSLSSAAFYRRRSSIGLYKILGMDDSTVAQIPMRLSSGDISHIVLSSKEDNTLKSVECFSKQVEILHTGTGTNKVLEITALDGASGDDTVILRYLDYVPFSSYKKLSFFIKASSVSSSSILEIENGDGSGLGAVIKLPLARLGDTWCKISLVLNSRNPELTAIDSNGNTIQLLGADASFSIPNNAGILKLTLKDFTSGSLLIDEVFLEDSYDGFSFNSDFALFYGDKKLSEKKASGTGFWVSLDAGASYDKASTATEATVLDAFVASGKGKLGFSTDYLFASINSDPVFKNNVFTNDLSYDFLLATKDKANLFSDSFSRDKENGMFGRDLKITISEKKLDYFYFPSFLFNSSTTEEAANFSQNWNTNIAFGSVLNIKAKANLYSLESVLQDKNELDSWLQSWLLVIPTDLASKNRDLSLSMDVANSILATKFSDIFKTDSGALESLSAKISIPFAIGIVKFAPYYNRSSSLSKQSSSTNFWDDLVSFADSAKQASLLWLTFPIYDLWAPSLLSSFENFAEISLESSHSAALGIEIKRPLGLGIWDFFIPSSFDLSWNRVLSSGGDNRSESWIWAFSAKNGAINIFSQISDLKLNFDEYSSQFSLNLEYLPEDAALLPTIKSNLSLSMEQDSGSIIAGTANFTLTSFRSYVSWNIGTSFAMSTKPSSTWLGNIFEPLRANFILKKQEQVESTTLDNSVSNTTQKKDWVSSWLETVFKDKLKLRNNWEAELSLTKVKKTSPYIIKNIFSYKTRVLATNSLSFGTGLGLGQSISIYDSGSLVWSPSYSLSIDIKVMF